MYIRDKKLSASGAFKCHSLPRRLHMRDRGGVAELLNEGDEDEVFLGPF